MVYGREWTGRRVVDRLTLAFERLPGTPIYSPSRYELRPALLYSYVDGADLILATGDILGRDTTPRLELLTYCRTRASRSPITELCVSMGWSRATFYRHVVKAAALVADALNVRPEPIETHPSAETPTRQ